MVKVDTITISKKEYFRLKELSKVDYSLVAKLTRGLEDIKHGRITEWKPSAK